jgi:transposase
MQFWTDVRHFVLVENGGKREACRRFNISWATLTKILTHSQPPGYRMKKERSRPKIEAFLPVIEQILIDDRTAPPKQRHNAKRIFDRLKKEHGFTGGYTIVKDAVRRFKRIRAQTYVPLFHPPGEAQVDYGFAEVILDGVTVQAALFVMSLPHSDAMFIRAYPRECTQTFQDGHAAAFEFFGGVPTRISYDNSRVAVKKFVGPRTRELTDGFLRLQSHYLFKEHFCLVRKANEKGHVENLVAYTRNNFLVPVPNMKDFEALNAHLLECCGAELDRSIRGKQGTKAQRLEEDRQAFLPLPADAFESKEVQKRRANSLSLVRFDRNDYSVPVSCAHHPLTVIGLLDEVRIMNKEVRVATHRRDWGKEAVHFDPVHYLALLERRPGAFDFARPMANWQLPSCFDLLRRRLEIKNGSEGTRQYIKVLRLLESSTVFELAGAVTAALDLGTLEADAVAVILQGRNEKPVGLFSLDGRPHLQGVQVKSPDLTEYAVLAERSLA